MLNKKIRDKLCEICYEHGGYVEFDHLLKEHSTIAIGGEASVWLVPSSIEELCLVKKFLDNAGIDMIVIGAGSNVLIPDEGLNAVIINLSDDFFRKISIENTIVTVGAGQNLSSLISICCKKWLSGLEGLVGIPATIGGALKVNALYKTGISERLVKVQILDAEGRTKWLDKKNIKFGYRCSSFDNKDIILQAVFDLDKEDSSVLENIMKEYFSEKMKTQPLDKKSLGCIFKNFGLSSYSAGELIDKAGLKRYSCGDAQVSEKHANFIVNNGKAAAGDVTKLIGVIRARVKRIFHVELETEIEILEINSGKN